MLIREVKRLLRNAYWWLWFHVWINENEFHSSLDLDVDAMVKMSPEKRDEYVSSIVYKRGRAHQMDSDDKKLNLRKNCFDTAFIIFISIVFAIVFTEIIYNVGVRNGISIVFFGSIVIFFFIVFVATRKPMSCCTKNGG